MTKRKEPAAKPAAHTTRPAAHQTPAAPLTHREENERREAIRNEGGNQARTAPAKAGKPIKVRAIARGYYDNLIRRPGDVFMLHDSNLFSEKWMERVDASTPEKVSTSGEDLRNQHDEQLRSKLGAGQETRVAPGQNVKEGDNPIDA